MNRYEKYKPSKVDFIGNVPNHWDVVKFNHFVELRHGFQFMNYDFTSSGIKIVKITQLSTDGHLDLSQATFINASRLTEFSDILIKEGDILMALTGGTIGKIIRVGKVEEPLLQNYRVGNFFRSNNKIEKSFIFWVLSSENILSQIFFEQRETGQPNIGKENFNSFKIALPFLKEQTTIANYLNEKTAQIDKLVANKQKLIELLKEERTAIINEAVTSKGKNWERKKLKYLAKLRDQLVDNSNFKIAVENIESASGKLVNMEEEKNYEGQLSAFKKGDTIFNKLRPYLHKVYFAEKDGGLFGELLIIYSLEELISQFLFYKLFSKKFIDIVDGSTQGTKMPRANWISFISQLLISFPKDKNEQRQIISHIQTETQRIDRTISKIEKEIELMQEYRTALISEVVTGKIKVV